MAKLLFRSRLARLWFSSQRSQGFTLLELLVVTLIGSLIIAGLMYIVVELMGVDQRESSRSETQREMQMAMSYMSSELREAVFVYTGDGLATANGRADGTKLLDYLPTQLSASGTVPIMAFWKPQPFPKAVVDACAAATAPTPAINGCITGSSYSLVVYSLSTQNPSSLWKGRARLTRYALTEFNSQSPYSSSTITQGYVNPASCSNTNFATWPVCVDTNGTSTNLQQVVGPAQGRPTGSPTALVDFVDDTPTPSGRSMTCPSGYNISPPDSLLTGSLASVRSFYACVSTVTNNTNQDVVLYLRGNDWGRIPRPGSPSNSFLPTLETRVLGRAVLNKRPSGD